MCQKKPGPRCSAHLVPQLSDIAQSIESMEQQLSKTEHEKALASSKLNPASLRKQAAAELYDEGNTDPTTTELFERIRKIQDIHQQETRKLQEQEDSLRRRIEAEKVRQKDLNERFLGTKTGQKAAAEKITKLHEEGRHKDAFKLQEQAERARELHEKSLEYAKWAEEVRAGRFPGRLVESEGTSGSASVRHSGDPLYDASSLDVAMLSDEELDKVGSGRYGAFAITPATREKISDERERRRKANDPLAPKRNADAIQAEHPEAWDTVMETSYGDNYLSTVWSRDDHEEGMHISMMHKTITEESAVVWDPEEGNQGKISYPEALSRAVAKEQKTSYGSPMGVANYLILDDDRRVLVDGRIFNALRFNKSPGLHKGV